MKTRVWKSEVTLWVLALYVLWVPPQSRAEVEGASSIAQSVVVVCNERDLLSTELAYFYAEQRGIPRSRVVSLRCPSKEEITRDEFDETIARPLRRKFVEAGWWKMDPVAPDRVLSSNIVYLALMRGLPLKILPVAEPYAGDRPEGPEALRARNEACVDSELAALGFFTPQISGALVNPYYRSFTSLADFRTAPLLAVCRLDAISERTVRKMIVESIIAERYGLVGRAYVDARGTKLQGYAEGDAWLFKAADLLGRRGIPVVVDKVEPLFPNGFPLTQAAHYYGWYAQDAVGPFGEADFFFSPGAVAAHIHSFSASTLRDLKAGWVGPLLAKGAAASFGNVYEPYLQFTTEIDLFVDRFTSGMTFGESVYAATRCLSWMNTFVGDPLYAPYRRWNNISDPLEAAPETREWLAYKSGVETWIKKGAVAGTRELASKALALQSGVIYEGLAILLAGSGDLEGAQRAFRSARRHYKNIKDDVRTVYIEVNHLRRLGKTAEALAVLDSGIKRARKSPSVSVLKSIESELKQARPKQTSGSGG